MTLIARAGRVGSHVQSVREQRHRAEEDTGGELHNHHGPGDGHDDQGASLASPFLNLTEDVVVLPG